MTFSRGGLRAIRTLVVVGLLATSLALNVAMFVGGAVFQIASEAFETLTGWRTVASKHAADVAELTDDLNAERRMRRELQEEAGDLSDNLLRERQITRKLNGELADVSDELVSERAVSRQLRGEATDLSDELLLVRRQLDDEALDLVTFRGRKVAISEAVEETADLISDRARKSATRELGSMAGEALPWIGVAVIVGVTSLEVRDLCATLKDMSELKKAFDPSLQPSENVRTVCAIEVPSRQEVLATVRASPGRAWEQAKAVAPTLEDVKNVDLAGLDWDVYQASIAGGFVAAYDAAGSALGGAVDATVEGATGAWEWLTEGEEASDKP